jgi:hypothetical protein
MAPTVMAASVMFATVVTSSMTSAVTFASADATIPSPSAAVTERMRQIFFSIFVFLRNHVIALSQ